MRLNNIIDEILVEDIFKTMAVDDVNIDSKSKKDISEWMDFIIETASRNFISKKYLLEEKGKRWDDSYIRSQVTKLQSGDHQKLNKIYTFPYPFARLRDVIESVLTNESNYENIHNIMSVNARFAPDNRNTTKIPVQIAVDPQMPGTYERKLRRDGKKYKEVIEAEGTNKIKGIRIPQSIKDPSGGVRAVDNKHSRYNVGNIADSEAKLATINFVDPEKNDFVTLRTGRGIESTDDGWVRPVLAFGREYKARGFVNMPHLESKSKSNWGIFLDESQKKALVDKFINYYNKYVELTKSNASDEEKQELVNSFKQDRDIRKATSTYLLGVSKSVHASLGPKAARFDKKYTEGETKTIRELSKKINSGTIKKEEEEELKSIVGEEYYRILELWGKEKRKELTKEDRLELYGYLSVGNEKEVEEIYNRMNVIHKKDKDGKRINVANVSEEDEKKLKEIYKDDYKHVLELMKKRKAGTLEGKEERQYFGSLGLMHKDFEEYVDKKSDFHRIYNDAINTMNKLGYNMATTKLVLNTISTYSKYVSDIKGRRQKEAYTPQVDNSLLITKLAELFEGTKYEGNEANGLYDNLKNIHVKISDRINMLFKDFPEEKVSEMINVVPEKYQKNKPFMEYLKHYSKEDFSPLFKGMQILMNKIGSIYKGKKNISSEFGHLQQNSKANYRKLIDLVGHRPFKYIASLDDKEIDKSVDKIYDYYSGKINKERREDLFNFIPDRYAANKGLENFLRDIKDIKFNKKIIQPEELKKFIKTVKNTGAEELHKFLSESFFLIEMSMIADVEEQKQYFKELYRAIYHYNAHYFDKNKSVSKSRLFNEKEGKPLRDVELDDNLIEKVIEIANKLVDKYQFKEKDKITRTDYIGSEFIYIDPKKTKLADADSRRETIDNKGKFGVPYLFVSDPSLNAPGIFEEWFVYRKPTRPFNLDINMGLLELYHRYKKYILQYFEVEDTKTEDDISIDEPTIDMAKKQGNIDLLKNIISELGGNIENDLTDLWGADATEEKIKGILANYAIRLLRLKNKQSGSKEELDKTQLDNIYNDFHQRLHRLGLLYAKEVSRYVGVIVSYNKFLKSSGAYAAIEKGKREIELRRQKKAGTVVAGFEPDKKAINESRLVDFLDKF